MKEVRMITRNVALPAFVCLLLLSGGCQKAYYSTWEKLGWEKRDILVDRVDDAKDSQEAAKEQFKTTLQRFQELTNYQGGELESRYKKLSGEYDRAKGRADDVTARIKAVDSVAQDMFKEWQQELSEYKNADMRRSSEQQLRATKDRYGELIAAMRQAESKMPPVLSAFHDQVLFLKHNLNAQAIASLQGTVGEINDDVAALIREMEASIAEANEFMSEVKKG
jgi:hypothetical protein